MTAHALARSDFATVEWHRLSEISFKYETKMRLAYTRAMVNGISLNKLQLRKVIIDCVSETCLSSAETYNLVFNPNSPIYITTVDRLVEKYVSVVESDGNAKTAVEAILPHNLTREEKLRRLNVYGLDARSAMQVENYRQKMGDGVSAMRDTARVRADAIRNRGNLLATTETNRVINAALEALWMDNQQISKAGFDEITYYDDTIQTLGNIPRRARKIIITRRDEKVCDYCDPLDGVKARLGEDFDTEYGLFSAPPFHPHCRCFLIISTS